MSDRLVEKAWGDTEPTEYEWVTDIEKRFESWEFDLIRVWRQLPTGKLFYAQDAGCSCPTPFEETTESELTEITKMQDFYDLVHPLIAVHVDPDGDVTTPDPRLVDDVNDAVWKISEILNPAQRPFGAIKHAA